MPSHRHVSVVNSPEADDYSHYLFFFANPRSGDQAAKKFLTPKKERSFNMKFEDRGINLFGHVCNITEKREKENCYKLIKKTYKKVEHVTDIQMMVVLMGGDGGLMRALNDL